jgi:hypothetical protein
MAGKRDLVAALLARPSRRSSTSRLRAAFSLLMLALAPGIAMASDELVVAGQVVTSTGEAIAGATVELHAVEAPLERHRSAIEGRVREPVRQASSDALGRFVIVAPEPGFWHLHIGAEGYAERVVRFEPLLEPRQLLPVELTPAVRVVVGAVDDLGAPIPAARVALLVPSQNRLGGFGGHSASFAADLDALIGVAGRRELALPDEPRARLVVVAPGFLPSELAIAAGSIEARPVAVSKRTLLVLEPDGSAASGAVVLIEPGPVPYALTDGAGHALVPVARGQSTTAYLHTARGGAAVVEVVSGHEPLRVPTQRAVFVRGLVLDQETRGPLVGATVWTDPGTRVTTGVDGSFALPLPLAGSARSEITLRAAARGFLPGFLRFSTAAVLAGEIHTLPLRPAVKLLGTVVDRSNAPVEDAQVRVTLEGGTALGAYSSDPAPGFARSDASGRFFVPSLPPNEPLVVRVQRDGFTPTSVLVAPGREQLTVAVDVVLGAGTSAFGVVVDEDEAPIPGARVAIVPALRGTMEQVSARLRERAVAGEIDPVALSDAEGRFELRDLSPGELDLEVTAAGFAPARVPGIVLPALETEQRFEIGTVFLSRGVVLEGRVVDAADRPLEDARVVVRPAVLMLSMRRQPGVEAVTGSDGRFVIEHLAGDQAYALDVSREGYATVQLPGIVPGGESPLVRLEAGATVRGRAVDANREPLERVRVMLQAEPPLEVSSAASLNSPRFGEAFTDQDGGFELRDLAPGRWRLSAHLAGYQDLVREGLVLRPGASDASGGDPSSEDGDELLLVLEQGAVLSGRVLGGAGEPLARALVRLRTEPGPGRIGSSRSSASDADGHYRLDGLPTVTLSILATHEEHQPTIQDIAIQPGENQLDLHLEPGLEIRGRIVDAATGQGVASVQVRAEPQGAADSFYRVRGSALSDAEGLFTLRGLGVGGYFVAAEKEGYARTRTSRVIELPSDLAGEVTLAMSAGAAIVGQISGLDFDQLVRVEIAALDRVTNTMMRSAPQHDGVFRVEHLGPGDWMLVATASGGKAVSHTVTIEPGDVEVIQDFEFGTGFRLAGRVLRTGPTGAEPALAHQIVAMETRAGGGGVSMTDQDGRFVVEGLAAGSYRLLVTAVGRVLPHVETVEVEGDTEILIELRESHLAGRVVDGTSGDAVAGATLALRSEGDASRYFGTSGELPTSDASGHFRLTASPGRYRLSVSKDGFASSSTEIELEEGSDLEGLEIVLDAATGIELTILRANGTSPAQVRVVVLDAAGRTVLFRQFQVGEGGRLRVGELARGRWTLIVGEVGGSVARVEVEVPSRPGSGAPVPVILPPVGGLRITVAELRASPRMAYVQLFDAAGELHHYLSFDSVQERDVSMNGIFFLPVVPVGPWTVTVRTGDAESQREWSARVEVAMGATTELEL